MLRKKSELEYIFKLDWIESKKYRKKVSTRIRDIHINIIGELQIMKFLST